MTGDYQEQVQEYQYLCSNLPDPMVVLGKAGKILMFSKRLEELSGYKGEELIGKIVFDLPIFAGANKALLIKMLEKRLSGEKIPVYDVEATTKNGEKRFIELNGCQIKYKGEAASLLIIRDITKRKKAEELLDLFKDAIESSSDAVGMSTPEGKHFYQNKTFSEMFGNIGNDPPGSIFADEKVGREVFQIIMAGNEWIGEVEMYGRGKKVLNILLRAYAVKDNNGKVACLVGIHNDITDRKKAEEALKKANEDLEEINKRLVGRELKMIELKEEIDQLRKKIK